MFYHINNVNTVLKLKFVKLKMKVYHLVIINHYLNYMKGFLLILFSLFISDISFSQDTIPLRNGSFEDIPHAGGGLSKGIRDWFDCGRINFPLESAPDIHPGGFWQNDNPPYQGNTYLGMVVRDNESWESVSQRLAGTLEADQCYDFSIALMKSNIYKSLRKETDIDSSNFLTPIVLRIWGGNSYCNQRVLLGESNPIDNKSWKVYNFEFNPNISVNYITFEAFYKTPTLFPYNGHLLIDAASDIYKKSCNGEEELAVAEYVPPHKASRKNIKETKPTITKAPERKEEKKKEAVINSLDKKKMKEGQTIKIEKLFFEADTAAISDNSYESLDEIYQFLEDNNDIEIEVGGHTNNIPKDEYCDKLSTARAKVIADYLIEKGIARNRIQFKGYGKRKPLASNKTAAGRLKNQRVEIKILKIG
jgi:outer membrane protein OmpA-like peptidoglycan-associated protein